MHGVCVAGAHKETVVELGVLSLPWDCLVFSLSLSRVKKTALSHVTSHFQSGPGSRAAEEHRARRGNNGRIQPPSSLALAMKSGNEWECRDVCPRHPPPPFMIAHDGGRTFYLRGL